MAPMQAMATNRTSVTTRALFTKSKPAVVEKVAPTKKSFTLFGKKTAKTVDEEPAAPAKSGFTLFSDNKKTKNGNRKETSKSTSTSKSKADKYMKQESILSAFDFSTARSKSDAELLYEARYGDLKGGKMSKEQYMALRRKVGGTAKDFWKTSIDVEGAYTDKGYVSKDGAVASSVPALPFLVGTILALFGALGYVITQTS